MKRGRKPLFYVFYDENDFVKCCGTAKELVAQGVFKSERYVIEVASKIRSNKIKGNVVALSMSEG